MSNGSIYIFVSIWRVKKSTTNDQPSNTLGSMTILLDGKKEENGSTRCEFKRCITHDRSFIDKVCDYIIEIKNQNIEEFNGNYNKYMENKNNIKSKAVNQKSQEEILILENKISNVISMLCMETNPDKKAQYE